MPNTSSSLYFQFQPLIKSSAPPSSSTNNSTPRNSNFYNHHSFRLNNNISSSSKTKLKFYCCCLPDKISDMADLRQRPTTSSNQQSTSSTSDGDDDTLQVPDSPKPPATFSQRAISQTLQSTANLANLLPTGTLLAFQLLIPIFTNNGSCDSATQPMTFILLSVLAVSCFLASFTDSFRASDGQVYYGFATSKGLWIFDYPAASASGIPNDLSKYRLNFIDVVHAVSSVLVFVAVALKDKNVVHCFYPSPGHETQEVLDIVPIGIGLICSLLFVVFPSRRHGIGYPVTKDQ